MSGKRLYRSRKDRMIAGVCGGLGEYFNIDPTLIRLALLFLVIWGGGGVLVYLIAWIVIPEEPLEVETMEQADVTPEQQPPATSAMGGEESATTTE
ncbi:MAG: PspC domain-containing protein [Caldilineae bacterium]|nr:MAG: PspC domain-containing protein [Caldilineae bacterium]